MTQAQLRQYYVLTPLFVGAMLLVPLADNLGIMWVAIESTTLASVLLVTFYNQRTSFEAGWKYIIIGSVGISLALFATIITYYSAVGVLGNETHGGMNWSVLIGVAAQLGHDDAALVADARRIDVLVRARVATDRGDVDAALVRERRAADVRHVIVGREVGELGQPYAQADEYRV